ncbi:anthrax toxin lethal factor-related metalloendopeptidase [Aquibacillus sediminis]|uniref:anthrax toxin lethal factor-related metalloendopeptidase n=1 Tax=Aquibacillus sediminis TaxID=2574734 RepID=UPI001109EC03|nr:toxin [Aquibacillus sediminis]
MLHQAMGEVTTGLIEKLSNADLLQELVVVPNQSNQYQEVLDMVSRINQIDRSVLKLLVEQNVKIRLFEGALTDEPLLYYLNWNQPRGRGEGTTWENIPGSGGNWLISAKIGASDPGNGHGSKNLELHEIGHTVYNLLMTSPTYATAIQMAWEKEVTIYFPDNDYFTTYPSEYFAEMFALYYYDEDSKEKMKQITPLTYQLFQQLQTLKTDTIERNYYGL